MRLLLMFSLVLFAVRAYSQFDIDVVAESDTAINYFSGLIEETQDPIWYMGRSYVYAIRGKYKKARKDFDYAVQFYQPPSDTLLDYSAKLYALQGKHKKAIMEAEYARELYPNNPEVHLLMGVLFDLKGDKQTALSHIDQTVHLFPDFAGAYYNRGRINRALFLGEAIVLPDLQMAVELSVRDSAELMSDAIYELAHYFGYLQKYDSAIYYFDKLYELDSNNYQLYNLGFRLGECYFFSENYDLAIEYFESSLFLYDDELDRTLFRIGRAYEYMNVYDTALYYYDDVFRLGFGVKRYKPLVILHRGICNFHLGHYDLAKKDLDVAIKKWYKKEADVHYYLGVIEKKEGNNKAACKRFEKASKLDIKEDDPLKQDLEEALKSCR